MKKQSNLSESLIVKNKEERERRRLLFKAFLLFISILCVLLTIFAKFYAYFPIDLVITREVQKFHPFWFDQLMKLITDLGYPVIGIPVIILCFITLVYFDRIKDASFFAISSIGATTIASIVKILVARPRPDPHLILQLGNYTKHDSFPSGHVLHFIGVYGFLLFLSYIHLKGKLRITAMLFFQLLIILIGLSRIYVGAHWFSDTMGAYLIGTVWLLLIVYFYPKVKLWNNN